MEGTESRSGEMQAAVDQLRVRLSTRELPRLEHAIGAYRSNYDHLYQLLVRKSLIKEDRYRYDAAPAKLAVPSDEEILDSQAHEQASLRLAAYRGQLELLATKTDLSIDKLSLATLRRIAGLMQYINWGRLADASESPITRCVADYVKRIKAANDGMASQLAATTVGQLDRMAREVLAIVERANVLQREVYKTKLRSEVLPVVAAGKTPEETVERVKRHFATALRGTPFYPELLQETLAEDSPSGDEARARALTRVLGDGPSSTPRSTQGDREALLQAMRALAAAAQPLADTVVKVAANDQAVRAVPEPKGLRALLRRFLHPPQEKPAPQVEYLDGAVMRTETIDLNVFLDEVTRQARLLAALARPDGESAAKIQRTPDRSLADFLERQAQALQVTYRRLAGLSELFRKQAPAEGALKGIKIELTLIKNSLIRSNQFRHQYSGARERGSQDPDAPR